MSWVVVAMIKVGNTMTLACTRNVEYDVILFYMFLM